MLVIIGILQLFVNTFTVDCMYSFRNSENLQHPIQMQLSEIQKFLSQFFAPFPKLTFNFN